MLILQGCRAQIGVAKKLTLQGCGKQIGVAKKLILQGCETQIGVAEKLILQRCGKQIGVAKKLILQGCGAAVGGAGSPWTGAGSTAGSGAFTLPSSHTHLQVCCSTKLNYQLGNIFVQGIFLPGKTLSTRHGKAQAFAAS
jgi:hypothetical protein